MELERREYAACCTLAVTRVVSGGYVLVQVSVHVILSCAPRLHCFWNTLKLILNLWPVPCRLAHKAFIAFVHSSPVATARPFFPHSNSERASTVWLQAYVLQRMVLATVWPLQVDGSPKDLVAPLMKPQGFNTSVCRALQVLLTMHSLICAPCYLNQEASLPQLNLEDLLAHVT